MPCRRGFNACSGDIIVMLDADGSTDPQEIPRFVAALCQGADFVKGSRFAQGGGSNDLTRPRSAGNWALNRVVNALYGTSYTDLCYGFNAFWARCLPYMRVDCDGFEVETLINVRIAKAGLVVHEVPSFESSRMYGSSNLSVLRDGLRVLRVIGHERWRIAGGPRGRRLRAHEGCARRASIPFARGRCRAERARTRAWRFARRRARRGTRASARGGSCLGGRRRHPRAPLSGRSGAPATRRPTRSGPICVAAGMPTTSCMPMDI